MSTFVAAIAVAVILSPILPAQAASFTIFGDYQPYDLPAPDDTITTTSIGGLQGELGFTVVNPGGPCKEDVHIEGTAHVLTDVRPGKEVVEIMVSVVAEMRGVGALTGAQYLAAGSVQKVVATPTLPIKFPVEAELAFVPHGPCRLPSPQAEHLTVHFGLEFDATGNLIRMISPPEFGESLLSGDIVDQEDPDDARGANSS